MTAFFSRFFFFISLGTLMAVTVLVWLQDEVGRSWAYGICSVSMGIAIIIFFCGTKRYRYKESMGSPIVHIFQVISAAVKKSRMKLPYDVNFLYEDTPEGQRVPHTQQFGYVLLLSLQFCFCSIKVCGTVYLELSYIYQPYKLPT